MATIVGKDVLIKGILQSLGYIVAVESNSLEIDRLFDLRNYIQILKN